MLGDITGVEKIFLITGTTDMRKSIDGLCAIIEHQLKMDSTGNALYLFCGRKRDRLKALFHEPDGYVLFYKRLTGTGTYKWPRNQSEVKDLTWAQFNWLMQGLEIEQPKAIKSFQNGNRQTA
ncbi:MAG: IS66 family insertion sequence element accessory protein TnpB [Clostridiales bacterium]|nr:IS66 family insertion sequence element accessory protein TnpB [Clostridiales bacterium]